MQPFKLVSDYKPSGDQPKAIETLAKGFKKPDGVHQTLLGVTGSGKTYAVANVVEQLQRPTLVLAHNKTLAAQLYNEFKTFFPDNAIGYFVSYYDYYQPEAYMPTTDTFIEKDASINDEIDKMRHAATHALFERRDVLIVASVSCIYGLGSPEAYHGMLLFLEPGMILERDLVLRKLIDIQYKRNDIDFQRGTFLSLNTKNLRLEHSSQNSPTQKIGQYVWAEEKLAVTRSWRPMESKHDRDNYQKCAVLLLVGKRPPGEKRHLHITTPPSFHSFDLLRQRWRKCPGFLAEHSLQNRLVLNHDRAQSALRG